MRKILFAVVCLLLCGTARAQNYVPIVSGVATVDASQGTNAQTSSFLIILTANVTSLEIIKPKTGQQITIILQQDSTGGRTVSCAADVLNCVTVTSTASAVTSQAFAYNFNTNKWSGLSGTTGGSVGAVSSVFTRTGAVTATSGDYTCAQVTNCTANGLTSFNARTTAAAVPTTGDYTCAQVTGCPSSFNITSYGGVADDSTDNCTPFTNLATAVNASTAPGPVTVTITQGSGAVAYLLSCTVNFTHPVTLTGGGIVDVKSTLAAAAFQMGPTGLSAFPSNASQIPPCNVDHLTFTGGSGGATGVECEKYVSQCSFNFNYCKNFGSSASTSWCFNALGANNEVHIIGNRWWQDDTTTGRNAFRSNDAQNIGSNTTQFVGNSIIGNGNPPSFTGSCAGIGFYIGGNWSDVISNSFYGFAQSIVVSNTNVNSSLNTDISDNAIDPTSCNGPGSHVAGIWLGDASTTGTISGLTVNDNRFGPTTSTFFQVTPTATVTLARYLIKNNILSGESEPTCSPTTGAGSGAACTVYGEETNFTVGITAGSSASSSGTVTVNFSTFGTGNKLGGGLSSACIFANGGTFDAASTFAQNVLNSNNVVLNWSNNGVSLTNTTGYYINVVCAVR